ncbi:hypothetical protein, partial [Streptomyces sp. NPDC058953]|uniref:hypothetical protein n=1 Tax=Streptomyces sp. NPDC058953 TaxID=3346676 RepID=UPI0036D0B0BC
GRLVLRIGLRIPRRSRIPRLPRLPVGIRLLLVSGLPVRVRRRAALPRRVLVLRVLAPGRLLLSWPHGE